LGRKLFGRSLCELFIVIVRVRVTIRFRFAAPLSIHPVLHGSIHHLLKLLARQHWRGRRENPRARVEWEWRVMWRALSFGLVGLGLSVSGVNAQSYGGGFIELLMTGRNPTPYVRPMRQNPV
jgi:hypothetical protein